MGTNSWRKRAKQYLWKMNLGKKVFLGVSKSILNVDTFLLVWNAFLPTSPPSQKQGAMVREGKGHNKEYRRGKERGKTWKGASPTFFKIPSGSLEVESAGCDTKHKGERVSLLQHNQENKSSLEIVTATVHSEMTKDLGRCAKSLNLTAPLGVMTELPSQLSLEEGQVLKTYPGLNSLMAARKPFQLLRDIRTAVGYLSNISRVAGRVPILVKAQTPAQRSFKGIKQMGGEVWAAAILIQSG